MDTSHESEAPESTLKYFISPIYDNEVAIALHVSVTLSPATVASNGVIFTAPVEIAKVDVGRLENVSAFDDEGPLPLTYETDDYGPPIVWQRWRAFRATKGTVRASYTALPRHVDSRTKNAPSFELRREPNGLVSSGYGFLLLPTDDDPSLRYEVQFQWDISERPKGSRAVCTWGEGPAAVTKQLSVSEVPAMYFMLGAVESHEEGNFGFYWMGTPPFDGHKLAGNVEKIFKRMAAFFEDNGDSYRIFTRHNPFRGSQAGTALRRSFMFSYDDHDYEDPPTIDSLALFLSHEMVHNWVNLSDNVTDNWYPEGLAEYYSIFLARSNGIISAEKFQRALNGKLTSYYTNPLVGLSNCEVAKLTWKLSDAQRIPYGRGLLFAIKIDALIRDRNKGAKTVDDIVLPQVQRRRRNEIIGISEFIDDLGALLADDPEVGRLEAQRLYDEMVAGVLVVSPKDSLAHLSLRLVRHDLPIWELGFDESMAIQGDRVISSLVPGSAAERAGLENGDRIMNEVKLDIVKESVDNELHLVVERKGKKRLDISFRPRGEQMVEAWSYVDVDAR